MNNYMKVIINAIKQWVTDKFTALDDALINKVDVVDGKGLSTEDFTTEHKNKLESLNMDEHNTSADAHTDIRESISDLGALVGDKSVSEQISEAVNGIEIPSVEGLATEEYVDNAVENVSIAVDSELSAESENPVQNKVVNEAISNLSGLVGDVAVSEQIEAAIAEIPEQTQVDWEQYDEAAVDYIKNKPRVAKKYFIMTDEINGLDYKITMENGNLVSALVQYMSNISITTLPAKTEYIEGETFDPTGMIVSANYEDDSSIEVVDYTYDTGVLTSDTKSVTITYIDNGVVYTTTVGVTVSILGISIKAPPTKTTYVGGEVFDPTGMVVVANIYNGGTRVIENYTYSTEPLVVGASSIDIIYIENEKTYTVAVDITVLESIPNLLVDFEYAGNTTGTYTLTGWKETLNGEASTEMIIPNDDRITL